MTFGFTLKRWAMRLTRWSLALVIAGIIGLFGAVLGMFAGSSAGNWFGTELLDIQHEGGLLFIAAGIVGGTIIGFVAGVLVAVLLIRKLDAARLASSGSSGTEG